MSKQNIQRQLEVGPISANIEWYQTAVSQRIESNCTAISFFNDGTSTVTIDQTKVIAPGQAFVIKLDLFVVLVHVFNIAFAAGGINNLVVCRITYNK
jgi:hypothetical protein